MAESKMAEIKVAHISGWVRMNELEDWISLSQSFVQNWAESRRAEFKMTEF